MKIKLFLILIPFLMFACQGTGIDYQAPELPPDLCMDYPVEKSLIRKVAIENNVALNELYYGLIDATAIGMLTDALQKEDIRDYLMDVRLFIEARKSLTYTFLIAHMTDANQWGEKWPLIEGILFRRITIFDSSLTISEHDRCLILSGLAGAERDLYL